MSLEDFLASMVTQDNDKLKLAVDLAEADNLHRYLSDPQLLATEFDLNPNLWMTDELKVSIGAKVGLNATLKRRWLEQAKPAWFAYKPKLTPRPGGELVVVLSDYQAPFHNQALHEASCDLIARLKPTIGIVNGDLVDFTRLSKYLVDGYKDSTVQQGVDSAYSILKDLKSASKKTDWYMLPGNHEQRLQNKLLSDLPNLYGLKRALAEKFAHPIVSVPHLLRLDELGFTWVVGEYGEWPEAQIVLSKYLVVMHGWLARKGSGASARATLEVLSCSCIVGHTHRAATIYTSRRDEPSGERSTYVAIEGGTMCDIERTPQAARNPDWQNALCAVKIEEDGGFVAATIPWAGGKLRSPW